MAYDRDSIDQAKKKGLFGENVFDSKALSLSEEEKKKLQEQLKQNVPEAEAAEEKKAVRPSSVKSDPTAGVELNFFEQIWIFLLGLFGKQNIGQYKLHKVLRGFEKELTHGNPPLYIPSKRRVSRYLGYKIHDLYLRTLALKKVFDVTMNRPECWEESSGYCRSLSELLFESLFPVNSDEIDVQFSLKAVSGALGAAENLKTATHQLEQSMNAYLLGLDGERIQALNHIYTNLIYFNALCSYDFVAFLKRFDPLFTPGAGPNFEDLSGEAALSYLVDLEEALLQIDLSMDNRMLFRKLAESALRQSELMEKTDAMECLASDAIDNMAQGLCQTIRDLLYNNRLTLLIRVIKQDPSYTPSIIHTLFDFHKIYSESFEKRVKGIVRFVIKDKKYKRIENAFFRVFRNVEWVGIYNPTFSTQLENAGFIGFSHSYHLALMHNFIQLYYEEMIKPVINLALMNGIFGDKFFQKTLSETFYLVDKFLERYQLFEQELGVEGASGKKIISQLAKTDSVLPDQKKNAERLVTQINTRAKDFFEEFYPLFVTLSDVMSKFHTDLESKPAKYLRNIHSIGGVKNSRFLSQINSTFDSLSALKESVSLLRE